MCSSAKSCQLMDFELLENKGCSLLNVPSSWVEWHILIFEIIVGVIGVFQSFDLLEVYFPLFYIKDVRMSDVHGLQDLIRQGIKAEIHQKSSSI